MMFLLASLICLPPKLINISSLRWNTNDTMVMQTAKERCKLHYIGSPCLKAFIKVDFNTYRAICGK
jgi:hypothetical protein